MQSVCDFLQKSGKQNTSSPPLEPTYTWQSKEENDFILNGRYFQILRLPVVSLRQLSVTIFSWASLSARKNLGQNKQLRRLASIFAKVSPLLNELRRRDFLEKCNFPFIVIIVRFCVCCTLDGFLYKRCEEGKKSR